MAKPRLVTITWNDGTKFPGLTIPQALDIVNKKFGVNLSRGTINNWLRVCSGRKINGSSGSGQPKGWKKYGIKHIGYDDGTFREYKTPLEIGFADGKIVEVKGFTEVAKILRITEPTAKSWVSGAYPIAADSDCIWIARKGKQAKSRKSNKTILLTLDDGSVFAYLTFAKLVAAHPDYTEKGLYNMLYGDMALPTGWKSLHYAQRPDRSRTDRQKEYKPRPSRRGPRK